MASILSKQVRPRFDATNAEHRRIYAKFLVTGKFEQKFYIEVPHYHNMLDMIRSKLAEHAVAKELKHERRERVEHLLRDAQERSLAEEAGAVKAADQASDSLVKLFDEPAVETTDVAS